MDNNETIKVYRSGGADPDGDHPGDLYVTLKVKELFSSIAWGSVSFSFYIIFS